MKAEGQKEYIYEMVSEIDSERRLNYIYTVVHRAFIREAEENGGETLNTEKKKVRRAINAILDELSEEKLKEAHVFLYSYFGGAA